MQTPNPGSCSTPSHLKHFEGKHRQQGVSGRAGVKPQPGLRCLTGGCWPRTRGGRGAVLSRAQGAALAGCTGAAGGPSEGVQQRLVGAVRGSLPPFLLCFCFCLFLIVSLILFVSLFLSFSVIVSDLPPSLLLCVFLCILPQLLSDWLLLPDLGFCSSRDQFRLGFGSPGCHL